MKKTLSLLVVFVILLSLCACGNSNNQNTEPSDFSQNTTENTEESTQETTEATQATTEESTTAPAEDPTTAPSEENDTKPADTSKPTDTSTPTHTHSYSAATCTQPKKCSCGATEGKALGHKWTDASCTTSKTCSVCKATEGSAVGHKWTNATCSTPKTCSVCKATEGEAAGHAWSDATCTAPKTCKTCKATEGSAADHSYKDATCITPKTCSVCKATEGNAVAHIVEGTICKMCKQVVPVDPSSFNASIPYSYVSKRYDGEVFSYPSNFDCYVFTLLDFGGEAHSEAVHDAAQCPYGKDGHRHVHHNGNYYDNIAQSFGLYGETTYKIVNSEIVVTAPVANEEQWDEAGSATIHFQLLSNGTLKVLSLSGTAIPEIAGIGVGAIFYPNPNPEVSYN